MWSLSVCLSCYCCCWVSVGLFFVGFCSLCLLAVVVVESVLVWLLLILFSLFSSCCCSRCVLDDAIFGLSLFSCCCCCWVVLCSPCPVGITPVRCLCFWSSFSAALLIPLLASLLLLLLLNVVLFQFLLFFFSSLPSLLYCCFVAICSFVVLTTSSSFFSSSPFILFLMPPYSIAVLFLCCSHDLLLLFLLPLHTVSWCLLILLLFCCYLLLCCSYDLLLLLLLSLHTVSWCLLILLLFYSYLFLCCSYDLLLHTVSWCCFVSLTQVHMQLVSGWGVGHDETPSSDPQLGSCRLRDVPPLPPPCAHPPARRSAPLGALPRADGRTFRVRRHLLAESQGRDGAAPRSSRSGIPSSWADVSQKRVRGFFCGFSLRGVFRECLFLVLPRSGSRSWDFYRSLLRISDGWGKNAEQLESRETVRHLRFVRPRQSRQRPQPACGKSNRPSGVCVGCRGRASASETSAVTPWREIPSRAIHLTDEGARVHPGPHQTRSAGCRLPRNPCNLRQCRLPTHVPVRSERSSERSGGQQLPGASHGRSHASLHLAPGTDSSRIPAEQNHSVWPVHGPA